jgi:TonB family protein
MKLNERANYMIALLLSLAFHFLILVLFMAGQLFVEPADLETFPVGMVEIAAGSPDGVVGAMGLLPEEAAMAAPAVENPGETQDKAKTVAKPKVTSKSAPGDAILVPKKDGKSVSEAHVQKPNPGGPSGDVQGTSGAGNSGEGKPFGFGSGEGMVTTLGRMPFYPKNAMNEGKEGNVAIRVLVKADGGLEQVTLAKSSGDSRLDKAAVSVIERTWQFKPVTKNYLIDLVFSFTIDAGVTLKFINSESRP